jgi:hypothetical protein
LIFLIVWGKLLYTLSKALDLPRACKHPFPLQIYLTTFWLSKTFL